MNIPFSLMAKPTGPACNLDCSYCYYLEKQKLYPEESSFTMREETLDCFIKKYIAAQPGREVTFAWQGGEPTLSGLNYFRKALQLQHQYAGGKLISNILQTNGTLLNEDWCRFLKDHHFLVGISLDGPEAIHDHYRVNKGGKGSFRMVMRGLELLIKYNVDFNTLTVVNDINAAQPLEVYRFLKQVGSRYMQFIPLVEKIADHCPPGHLSLVLPSHTGATSLAAWSAPSLAYGKFLIAIFNEWVKKDVGQYFVPIFDAALANEVGAPAGACVFNAHCGDALVMEYNGDVFSCDHYVYPAYKLGNITNSQLQDLLQHPVHRQFSQEKYTNLPGQCKRCDVYKYCRGECPKNRHLTTATGEKGLNYFCQGYQVFFRHIRPHLRFMANELAHRRSPANIMHRLQEIRR